MRSYRLITALLATLVLGTLAGACSLNPKEDPTRYYVLTNLAEDPDLVAGGSFAGQPDGPATAAGPSVGVRVVSFPSYLNRSRMVTRLTGNEVELMETERWGEPLEDAFLYSLAQNLGVLLGTDEVVLHPWYSIEEPEYRVRLDIIRFERDAQGTAHLVAQWELRSGEDALLSSDRFETTEAADPASISSSVEAQSRALAVLSRQIGEAIRTAGS